MGCEMSSLILLVVPCAHFHSVPMPRLLQAANERERLSREAMDREAALKVGREREGVYLGAMRWAPVREEQAEGKGRGLRQKD